MSVTLTAADLARIREVQDVLASPLTHRDITHWLQRAVFAVRELLGAAHASAFVADSVPELLHTTLDEAHWRSYAEHFAAADMATPRALQQGLTVAHLFDVVTPGEYFASELHRGFAAPNSLFDAMLLRTRSDAQRDLWIATQQGAPLDSAGIEHRRALLQLVHPAFTAGAALMGREMPPGSELGRLLDVVGAALLLCDRAGRVLHQNAALRRLLATDSRGPSMLREMVRMATALGRHSGAAGQRESPIERGALARSTLAPGGRCRITATRCEGTFGSDGYIVVQLDRLADTAAARDDLGERFGLTTRESEVARHLADRLTNREIAQALSISEHTAERHTERVLQKLRVRSRTDVRRRIAEG